MGKWCVCVTALVLMLTTAAATAQERIRILLVGDSTVTDKAGWGAGFAELVDEQVEVINLSRGGRSSRTFREEGLWGKALETGGHYVLIQFGHNDESGTDRSTDRETEFPVFMRQYVEEARAAGIKPVLVTPLVRRQFKGGGTIESSLARHAEIVRQIARELDVPLVDLHDRSLAVCNALGREVCITLMSSPKPNGQFDGTHLTRAGSMIMGAIVADELKKAVPELAERLRPVPLSSMPPATQPAR